jgi:hypothetical protein
MCAMKLMSLEEVLLKVWGQTLVEKANPSSWEDGGHLEVRMVETRSYCVLIQHTQFETSEILLCCFT